MTDDLKKFLRNTFPDNEDLYCMILENLKDENIFDIINILHLEPNDIIFRILKDKLSNSNYSIFLHSWKSLKNETIKKSQLQIQEPSLFKKTNNIKLRLYYENNNYDNINQGNGDKHDDIVLIMNRDNNRVTNLIEKNTDCDDLVIIEQARIVGKSYNKGILLGLIWKKSNINKLINVSGFI